MILGNVGRFPEAAAALERTVSINPRHVTARFKLALAYVRLGDHARAERALAAAGQRNAAREAAANACALEK